MGAVRTSFGQAAHLCLGRRHGGLVGRQVGRFLLQLARVTGTGGESGAGRVLELPAHLECGGALLQDRSEGEGLVLDFAAFYSFGQLGELRIGPAIAGVRTVGLIGAHGLAQTERGLHGEVVDLALAQVDQGEVRFGEVGRVARLVDVLLAVEESLGEILQLGCPLVAVLTATGHVGLVAASNINQAVGDGSEQSLLTRFVAGSRIFIGHPLPLSLEIAYNVFPDFHVGHCGLETSIRHVGSCLVPFLSNRMSISLGFFIRPLPPLHSLPFLTWLPFPVPPFCFLHAPPFLP